MNKCIVGVILGWGLAVTSSAEQRGDKAVSDAVENPALISQEEDTFKSELDLIDDLEDFGMSNPGSIAEQYFQDRQPKEYLFQFRGLDNALEPWSKLRFKLDEKYGFKPNIAFTHLYQWANETVGPEDDASGFDLTIDGTWDVRGRGTQSPGTIGFEVLYRDELGTDLPPVALFTQVGSLYPTSVGFADISPTIGQLWYQQIYNKKFGFRVGKYNPVPAYDFFPMKNFKTDFVDGIHAANLVIPLPDRGLGGYVMYRPKPDMYIRVGAHDANAETTTSGFNSLFDEGELFTIFEVGIDPGIKEPVPGRPPFGDVHLTLWHQEELEDAGVDDGWGFVMSGSQTYGRYLPFLRYGYADSGSNGPTAIEHMVNGGVAFNNIFGQQNDRIAVALSWTEPTDSSLDDQKAIDMFYRIQMTPQIVVTPMLQLIFDPVRNPDEDTALVLGIRSRIAF